jgi:hypothetical protein
MLVGQHDMGIADPDLSVVDPAARTIHPHHLLGAERPFVESDGLAGTAEDQIRRHAVIALRDRFYCSGHKGSL